MRRPFALLARFRKVWRLGAQECDGLRERRTFTTVERGGALFGVRDGLCALNFFGDQWRLKVAIARNHEVSSQSWQPRQPLDPCRRMRHFGPIQPMERERSLLYRILFG
jgi:hypothetical protein